MNILGRPFQEFVTNQINTRQDSLNKGIGDSTGDLLYQQSKTPWIRMASSVDIDTNITDNPILDSFVGLGFDANNISEIEKATEKLRKQLSAKGVLLTLSERGICINSEKEYKHTPAFKRNIIDVSGAGDTVISVASLCLASNMDYTDLSVLSTLAGGIVCEEVGVVPINKEKLLTQALKHIS